MKDISSLSITLISGMVLIHIKARMEGEGGEDGCEL